MHYSVQWAGGCLPKGVSAQGVSAQGVSVQGVSAQGVSAQEVSAWECLPRGYLSQHAMGQTPLRGQTDTCENITFTNFVCWR